MDSSTGSTRLAFLPVATLVRAGMGIDAALREVRYFPKCDYVEDLEEIRDRIDQDLTTHLLDVIGAISSRSDIQAAYREIMSVLEAANDCPDLVSPARFNNEFRNKVFKERASSKK